MSLWTPQKQIYRFIFVITSKKRSNLEKIRPNVRLLMRKCFKYAIFCLTFLDFRVFILSIERMRDNTCLRIGILIDLNYSVIDSVAHFLHFFMAMPCPSKNKQKKFNVFIDNWVKDKWVKISCKETYNQRSIVPKQTESQHRKIPFVEIQ